MERKSHSHPNSKLLVHLFSTINGMLLQAKNEFVGEDELVDFCSTMIALCHDIAKDTTAFSKHLSGESSSPESRHSGSSAYIALAITNYILNNNENILKNHELRLFVPNIIYTVISSHHSTIKQININEFKSSINEWLLTYSNVSKEIIEFIFNKYNINCSYNVIFDIIKNNIINENFKSNIQYKEDENLKYLKAFVLIRIFLGNLFNADNISAYCQSNGLEDNKYDLLKDFSKGDFSNIDIKINSENNDLIINKKRTEIQDRSIQNFKNNKDEKFFVLSAPTGMGKTICLIKLLKEINPNKVSIYCPSINICNQTFDETKKYISNNDIMLKTYLDHKFYNSNENNLDENEGNIDIEIKDNFDASLLITTFNRFHDLYFSLDRKKCVNYNGLKNALFIFDEFHELSNFSLPIYFNMFYVLNYYLGIKFILVSATPKSNNLIKESFACFNNNEEIKIINLLDSDFIEQLNSCESISYRRKYKFIGTGDVYNISSIVNLMRYEQPEKSCIVFCNLVNNAKILSEILRADYCITANLTPKDIKKQIQLIKEDLKNKKNITVVCSPVIQAGVDLDFDIAFIDANSMQQILQPGGRCGRNFFVERGTCSVFIFEIECESFYKKGMYIPSWFKQKGYDKENIRNYEKNERDCTTIFLKLLKKNNDFMLENFIENLFNSSDIENKIFDSFEIIMGYVADDFYKFSQGEKNDTSPYFSNLFEKTKIIQNDENMSGLAIFVSDDIDVFYKIQQLYIEIDEILKIENNDNFFENYKRIKLIRKEILKLLNPLMLRRLSIINEVENFKDKFDKNNIIKKFEKNNFYYILNAENNFYNETTGFELNQLNNKGIII